MPTDPPAVNLDGATALHALIYTSTARRLFSDAMLRELLEQARTRNARLGITGCLLYYDGSFMQYLEGPREGVQAVFASIQRDPRHHQVGLLHQGPIERREFADWWMAAGKVSRVQWDGLARQDADGPEHLGRQMLLSFVQSNARFG